MIYGTLCIIQLISYENWKSPTVKNIDMNR